MRKFNTLKSIPAYLPIVNIDTDMIIPKQFLKTIKRTGLGKNLFFEMRYDENGNIIHDFVLNKDPYNNSKILIAGNNFGCGSSREHAPWALLDFGITCVISSSYADIFYNNCFKNGILPIILEDEKIKELSEYAKRKEEISINLSEEKILYGNNEIKFNIDPFKKKCLLEGLDDIALSLKKSEKIEQFEILKKAKNTRTKRYRKNVDEAYDNLDQIALFIKDHEKLKNLSSEINDLKYSLNNKDYENSISIIDNLFEKLSEISGTDEFANKLDDLITVIDNDEIDEQKLSLASSETFILYDQEVSWREDANKNLLPQLMQYNEVIKNNIGLRLQSRLTKEQAKFVARCNSVHRDISLNF